MSFGPDGPNLFPHPKPVEQWPDANRPIVSISTASSVAEIQTTMDRLNAELRVGDVLLCASRGWMSGTMRGLQAPHVFHEDHRRWVHAAMYVGGNRIVEKKKSFSDWRQLDLDKYLLEHDVLIRRPVFAVTQEQRTALVSAAFPLLKKRYNWVRALNIGWRSIECELEIRRRNRLLAKGVELPPRVIAQPEMFGDTLCHEMVGACYMDATTNLLVPEERFEEIEYFVIPAALSWSPVLRDVQF